MIWRVGSDGEVSIVDLLLIVPAIRRKLRKLGFERSPSIGNVKRHKKLN